MILEKIREILSEQLGVAPEDITPESAFDADLHADSLDAVEFAMALEEEFDLTLEDEDIYRFKTVGDVVEYLSAKVEE